MRKLKTTVSMLLCLSMITAAVPIGGLTDIKAEAAGEIVLTADFGAATDPPLLKKVEMYNAGCIQPLSNYDRDFSRIQELNSTALRIDLSIGKDNGTAGQNLVDANYGYHFEQLDSIVNHMTSNDILPYMSWCYVPTPLQENGDWLNLNTSIPNWQGQWEEIYYNYAKHYVDAGIQIGYHEIYNEPDLEILKDWGVFDAGFRGFLDVNDFKAGVYPDMYEYGVRGILRADPDATVGGPVFALGEIGVQDWTGFIPRVLEKNLPLDFYSYHTYLDGETWFMSEAQRNSGAKNEHEQVVDVLSQYTNFLKTSIHLNEYTYLNNENGAQGGAGSPFNYYAAGSNTLDAIMEAVDRTTVTQVYWAQFMESTAGDDPYGIIRKDGTIKPAFNAIKLYNDMPEWRYAANFSDGNSGLRSVVSSDDDKLSILVWNTTGEAKELTVNSANAKFNNGTRRVYRIDSAHASAYDGANPELVAEEIQAVSANGTVWSGSIPAEGVVYITINKTDKNDFNSFNERTDFADYVKTQYYYEDRYRGLSGSRDDYNDYKNNIHGSYSYFDSTSNTMFLGMGSYLNGQAHASSAIITKNIPEQFSVRVQTEGNLVMQDSNSTLGFRVDFYDEASGQYTKSVYFHNGLYDANRNPNAQDAKLSGQPDYPWGTGRKADEAVAMSGEFWEIDLTKYAPAGWSSSTKVQISFDMQNTGANTRAAFTLSKESFTDDTPIVVAIDEEHFPDEIFRSFVKSNYDKNGDSFLSEKEIAAVTSINVNNKGISSLKGIEYLTALTNIECHQNNLTSLDVSALKNLEWLACGYNQLTELDLSGLTNLHDLYCYQNQISYINLDGVTNLTNLICDANQLTSLQLDGYTMNNLVASDNTYTVQLSGKSFDLSKLPGDFDAGKASDWTNASYANGVITVADDSQPVTYSYNTGAGSVTFTLIPVADPNGNTALYGDANDDKSVDVADAVFILQSIADPSNDEFTRTAQGETNADCQNVGNGVDAEDALAILQFKASIIKELPTA